VRVLLLCFLCSGGVPLQADEVFAARHQRSLWWDRPGELRVSADGLQFVAASGKAHNQALDFAWNDVQQCLLSPSRIEIVTYRDRLWQFGRDRQFHFQLVVQTDRARDFRVLEEVLHAGLGQRLVRALPGEMEAAVWALPAKRTGLLRGAEGTISFDGRELRFDSDAARASRRWTLQSIASISSTGPLSLTVVAPERALSDQGGHRSFEFQLKQPLSPERYRELWLAIEAAHGTRLRFQPVQLTEPIQQTKEVTR
jgi:hypothetical protein